MSPRSEVFPTLVSPTRRTPFGSFAGSLVRSCLDDSLHKRHYIVGEWCQNDCNKVWLWPS